MLEFDSRSWSLVGHDTPRTEADVARQAILNFQRAIDRIADKSLARMLKDIEFSYHNWGPSSVG